MKYLQDELKLKICGILAPEFEIDPNDILFTIPPNRNFGDLSSTIPFVMAKKLKQKPFVIGKQMLEKMNGQLDLFSDIQLAGGGFLNFYFKKNVLLNYLKNHAHRTVRAKGIKMIVEHTSINPNKSAHIGHLRNSCLGDTLANSLRFLGYEVEVQNYLDDTGIQVSDVVWGLMYYEHKSLDEIKKIADLASYLWFLYPAVSQLFERDENAKQARNEVHKKIEEKVNPEYAVSVWVAEAVLQDHIRVMDLLGIRYDLLVRESDIIALNFFKEARELMEEKGVMYPSQDPEKQGCMVIKYEKENIEKIIVRSNGTVTYIGKDIAYTLWKVGLFDRDFYYRIFYTYPDDHQPIYISDYHPHPPDAPYHFGGGESVYNVIDVRQSYLQNIIAQILGPLSPVDHQKKFIHFSYEMVALTPRCVEEMGFAISDEDKSKAYVEVSGRKGIGVKADELIAKLNEKSVTEVRLRHPEMDEETARRIAGEIAIGALRYFMIKFSSNSVIAFDFKDALAFEGDTGPYLQYTLVRINSILNKLRERGDSDAVGDTALDMSLLDTKEYAIYYELLLVRSMLEIEVELALNAHELSGIANYTYMLCQKFNQFYHLYSIAQEKDLKIKELRLQLVLLIKAALEKLLAIMGIPTPEKM
ncbi:MAG: arginine--tRNA ligase [Candidatus Omnitrophota bacterium]